MERGRVEGSPARRPRGDLRAAVLALLDEAPMHGYQMIQEISRRSDGRWKPSAGSIYPVLQLLEDEALATTQQSPEGRRLFELTVAGREQAAQLAEKTKRKPWELPGQGAKQRDPLAAMSETARVLLVANGRANAEQRAQITALLDELCEQVTALVPDRPNRSRFADWASSQQRPSASDWPFNVLGSILGGKTGPFGDSGKRGPRTSNSEPQSAKGDGTAEQDDDAKVDEEQATDV